LLTVRKEDEYEVSSLALVQGGFVGQLISCGLMSFIDCDYMRNLSMIGIEGLQIMKWFRILHCKQYLIRIVALGCLSVCIPIILIGAVYYHYAEQSVSKQIVDEAESSLLLSKDRVERILQGLELDSYRLATNSIVKNSINDSNFGDDLIGHGNIINLLEVTKNANDFISDIIYFNKQFRAVLSNKFGYITEKLYPDDQVIQAAMGLDQPARWVYLPYGKQMGYLSYVLHLPLMTKTEHTGGFIMIHANTQEISNYLVSSLSFSLKVSFLVLDDQNQYLLGTGEFSLNGDNESSIHVPVIRSIIGSKDHAGHLFDNSKALYAFFKSSLGRTYILKIPHTEITSNLKWNRMFFFITLSFFLGLGLLLTLVASLSAYKPIQQLLALGKKFYGGKAAQQQEKNEISFIRQCLNELKEKSDKLTETIDHLNPALIEQFFQKLIEENTVIERLVSENEHIRKFTAHSEYTILVVTVSDLHKDGRFSSNDQCILTFIIKNVMKELLEKEAHLTGSILQDSKGRGIAVLYGDDDMPPDDFLQAVKNYANKISSSIKQYLKLNVYIGVGNVYKNFTDISASYREALLALQKRIYRDYDSVLYITDSLPRTGTYYYPFHLKQTVVDTLAEGDYAKAEKSLNEYIRALRASESYEIVSHGYNALLYAIMDSLERKYEAEYLQLLDLRLFEQLQERKTPREVFDWFVEYLFPMYRKIQERHSNVHEIIQRVRRYIIDHVSEDLSLTHIAEIAGVSPSHLSRLFKKEMGISFLDYVLECKIREAMRMMDETDMSISEIAAKIGYSDRNFSRIFQKFMHMTPGQYRAM
jgi:two-component system response regulator YesN